MTDYEASFLRLIEKITNGCGIKINETGTKVSYKPGVLVGGIGHSHDCGCVSRRACTCRGRFLNALLLTGKHER